MVRLIKNKKRVERAKKNWKENSVKSGTSRVMRCVGRLLKILINGTCGCKIRNMKIQCEKIRFTLKIVDYGKKAEKES